MKTLIRKINNKIDDIQDGIEILLKSMKYN